VVFEAGQGEPEGDAVGMLNALDIKVILVVERHRDQAAL
jgi:hypothetical protein